MAPAAADRPVSAANSPDRRIGCAPKPGCRNPGPLVCVRIALARKPRRWRWRQRARSPAPKSSRHKPLPSRLAPQQAAKRRRQMPRAGKLFFAACAAARRNSRFAFPLHSRAVSLIDPLPAVHGEMVVSLAASVHFRSGAYYRPVHMRKLADACAALTLGSLG